MSRLLVSVLAGCVCCSYAAMACAEDPWKGALTIPRSRDVTLVGDAGLEAGVDPSGIHTANKWPIYLFAWPATVERVEGQWVLIRDKGGYTVPPLSGWVRKGQMLRLAGNNSPTLDADPIVYFTSRIGELKQKLAASSPPSAGPSADLQTEQSTVSTTIGQLAALYWLRGMCLEANKTDTGPTDPGAAINDYVAAIQMATTGKVDPLADPPTDESDSALWKKYSGYPDDTKVRVFPGLPDLYLRLGRLLAAKRNCPDEVCDGYFDVAKKLFGLPPATSSLQSASSVAPPKTQDPPQLYTDWGDALVARAKLVLSQLNTAALDKHVTTIINTLRSARVKYRQALNSNPHWFKAPFGLGESYLLPGSDPLYRALEQAQRGHQLPLKYDDLETRLSDSLNDIFHGAPSKAQAEILVVAIRHYSQAIALDPSYFEAYRQRAEALLRLSRADAAVLKSNHLNQKQLLVDADKSATKAADMKNDRNSASLRILAIVLLEEAMVSIQKQFINVLQKGDRPSQQDAEETVRHYFQTQEFAPTLQRGMDFAVDAITYAADLKEREKAGATVQNLEEATEDFGEALLLALVDPKDAKAIANARDALLVAARRYRRKHADESVVTSRHPVAPAPEEETPSKQTRKRAGGQQTPFVRTRPPGDLSRSEVP